LSTPDLQAPSGDAAYLPGTTCITAATIWTVREIITCLFVLWLIGVVLFFVAAGSSDSNGFCRSRRICG
jgi:hypothetical protein